MDMRERVARIRRGLWKIQREPTGREVHPFPSRTSIFRQDADVGDVVIVVMVVNAAG